MIVRVLVILAVLGLLWFYSPMSRRGGWRLYSGLGSVVILVIGAIMVIRGQEVWGLPVVGLSLAIALASRMNRGARAKAGFAPEPAGMSASEARAILGVAPDATPEQIRAAYTRLMQRAHPDKGGTTGLAAQLNAARDRLLK
ncbi:MAG: DnaJ domain-containing protein [Caulobacteraceae bacterium]